MLSVYPVPPGPAGFTPQVALPITAGIDEGGELGLRYGRPGDGERLHFDRMRPFLVVEDERVTARLRSQEERAAWNTDVAGQRATSLRRRACAEERRRRITERLPRVGERFGVHIFVKHGETDEIDLFFGRLVLLQPAENAVTHLTQIGKRPVS